MNFRTDLAKEKVEEIKDIEGVCNKEINYSGIKGNYVEILSETASKRLSKPKGKYITLETEALINRNVEEYKNISNAIAKAIKSLFNNEFTTRPILIVGLGNKSMTPDSIGPRVIDNILVTRHIFEFMPNEIDERMNSVCALAPGVLGVTGIESADVIFGICKKLEIGSVIVIDALASRKSERMFTTFQLTDTGIEPGAGVGNKRSKLTEDVLGVKVIAIGVPTVIYASSLVYDGVMRFFTEATGQSEKNITDAVNEMSSFFTSDMVVTPKEIDIIAKDSAKIIADGINLAVHNNIPLEEIEAYMF